MKSQHGVKTEHMVKVLNRGTTGTLDQVIDGADQNNPWSIFPDGDVDIVGPGNKPRGGKVRHDANETGVGVVRVQALAELIGGRTVCRMDINRR